MAENASTAAPTAAPAATPQGPPAQPAAAETTPQTYSPEQVQAMLKQVEDRTAQRIRSETGREVAEWKRQAQGAKVFEGMSSEQRQAAAQVAYLAENTAKSLALKYNLTDTQAR